MKPDLIAKDFKHLTVDELHDLLRLRTDVFVVEQACAYAEIDGRDKEAVHIMGKLNGEVIACARILPARDGGLPHIGRVVVHRANRGKGFAHALMTSALQELLERTGSRRSELAAQAHLEKFYSGFGFVRVSDDYPWDGIPHVDMRREED
ncbi:MAG TPA: GNAT family N-acetyltransferase [Flavobacteriales bacterium]|nr:GNAT family N-acetyltransferase [Flavobacteriales bacterium]